MLNHASDVNRKRLDLRLAKNRDKGTMTLEEQLASEPMIGGKKLTELTSEEYAAYLSRRDPLTRDRDMPLPRVIKTKKPDA